jgi:hypothetical protein
VLVTFAEFAAIKGCTKGSGDSCNEERGSLLRWWRRTTSAGWIVIWR